MNLFLDVCKTRSTNHSGASERGCGRFKDSHPLAEVIPLPLAGWVGEPHSTMIMVQATKDPTASCTSKTPQEPSRRHSNTSLRSWTFCLCRHHLPVNNIQGTSSVSELEEDQYA